MTPDELLTNSRDVTLARAIAAETLAFGDVRYTFEVIQRFSGPNQNTFDLIGSREASSISTFNDHTDAGFWETGGRSAHFPDCRIHPDFTIGKAYLVFLDQPYTHKSFEQIEMITGDTGARDKWLTYVQRHFGGLYRAHTPPWLFRRQHSAR